MTDPPSQTATMLDRFIDVFHRGIAGEMDAMRKRIEAFEIPITNGRSIDSGRRSAKLYTFTILKPDDRLLLNAECILTHNGVEGPVTIIDLDGEEVTISSESEIELGAGSYALVIYPWFLYEKLDAAVASLSTGDFHTANALMLFGRGEPRMEPAEFRNAHDGLNASQERAIRLCCESNLAFVWGPPGTGKTTTLGHIVTELTARGLRVLITSNTNAAVDQALAKLAELEEAQSLFAEGAIVRVGQLGSESHGAGLHEVVRKVHANVQRKLDGLRGRLPEAREEITRCDAILKRLETNRGETQFDLFREVKPMLVTAGDLAPLFPAPRAGTIARLPAEEQYELIARHR
ncbi:MAG: AAA domain-containing protein, partial [Candidatus Kapaibacterium sp.]